ncbi:MauE/DoxX family redox-associated membrane protein [Nonomuraea sp. NPDC050556]|uniref:MauE/DoxX family redox-associated membrane protein n=1 Tax=Nonomuraea sp. NPDC050556 TaxID=3364369 RepID=UPI003787E486
MLQGIAALQPYVIAVFLVWAALMKLLGRQLRTRAGQSALARLVGPARAIPAFRLAAVAELAVAVWLVTAPGPSGVAAVALSLGFLSYLTYAAVAAPTSSCGCLGTHARPVEWRSFTRAGLLLAMSVTACWAVPFSGWAWLGLVEAAILIALSPELDHRWLFPLRRLIVRLRRPLTPSPASEVPLEVSLRTLYRSPAYCSASALLTSDLQDAWDEDGLRYASYAAAGRTAVFAIPLTTDDPSSVRVALVPA